MTIEPLGLFVGRLYVTGSRKKIKVDGGDYYDHRFSEPEKDNIGHWFGHHIDGSLLSYGEYSGIWE